MDTLSKVAAVLFGLFIVWQLFRYLRSNPEALSMANINKSMASMGILAVVLIAFIGAVVLLLRRT